MRCVPLCTADHGKNVLLLVGVDDSELVQLGAHKQILALRSPVMAKTMREMLEAPGGNTKDLTLRLPYSQAACETMLRVLYTGMQHKLSGMQGLQHMHG